MELDELFDELEYKFAQPRFQWDNNINVLTVQTIDHNFVDLLAPIIGVDFVAGLDQTHADWLCFANHYIAHLKPKHSPDEDLPLLRKQDIKLCGFIKSLERPIRVTVKYVNQSEAAFNLLDTDDQFLITEQLQLIPAQAIVQLRMLGTNSWQ
jgi:hypothetical protein